MDSLVSIIVPVYNVEQYVVNAIDSIICQTYDNIEVIIVNDGSTDSSGEICKSYVEKHPDKIRLINQKNMGLSAARNRGIDMASGEYIMFVDSDDTIAENAVELLLSTARSNDADIVVTNYSKPGKNRKIKHIPNHKLLADVLNQTAPFTHSAWGKLYKSTLFKDSSNRFAPGIIYEDLDFFPRIVMDCERIVYIDSLIYYYNRTRTDSITNCKKTVRTDVLEITKNIQNRLENDRELYEAAVNRRFAANFNIFYLTDNIDLRNECWNVVCSLRKNVLFNRKARLKNRVGALVSFLGKDICRLLK